MLRYLFTILLILNIAFWGWTQGWFGDKPGQRGHEPNRITAQTRPDAIQIAPPQEVSLSQDNGAVTPENTGANISGSHDSPLLPAEPLILLCLEAGPLNGAQSSLIQRIVGEMLPQELWEMDAYTTTGSWAVYMGTFDSESAALTRKNELNSIRIDAEIVRGKSQYQPGLTLGLFTEQLNAQKLLASVQAKGITDARIERWTIYPTGQLLRVLQVSPQQKEQLDALIAQTDIPAFTPCENNKRTPSS